MITFKKIKERRSDDYIEYVYKINRDITARITTTIGDRITWITTENHFIKRAYNYEAVKVLYLYQVTYEDDLDGDSLNFYSDCFEAKYSEVIQ